MEKEAKGFRALTVWKKAYELALLVYRMSKNFPKQELYGMTSQLQRAVISVPANIAEGYERNHRKEYVQFLYIAKGSLGEVETYLQLAYDLGYLNAADLFRGERDSRGDRPYLKRIDQVIGEQVINCGVK